MRKTVLWLLCGGILLSSLAAYTSAEQAVNAPGGSDENLIEELKLFSKAIGAIVQAYVEDKNPRDLLYAAVKGMLTGLDRYSEFIEKERYELLEIHMKGEYAGIGAILEVVDGGPAIKEVQPGSLAEKAGLLADDRIYEVDHKDVRQMAIGDVAALIRGEPEVPVLLTLWRPALNKQMDVEIKREKIEIESVHDVRMVGRAIGYFRISNFQANTADQVDAAIKKLDGMGMEALIIDLRNNNGGLMPQAVALAERFLPKGDKILTVKSKIEAQRAEYISSGEHTIPDLPLVILVNEASASSSEIFSAAVQDHKRATIVGARTFGKASVQSVIPLDDVTAMKLTTARYLSGGGRMIDQVGLTPDIEVPYHQEGETKGDSQILKAVELLKDHF